MHIYKNINKKGFFKKLAKKYYILTKVSKNIILFKAYFLRKENSYKRQRCLKKRKGGRFYGKNDASTKEKTKIKSAWI